ncbi:MAG: glycosyltransferase family 2 protein [Solirubrobacterales bacterium]
MTDAPRGDAPAISVVVPTRNRRSRLAALLSSLGQQSLPPDRFEVIVVDDASDDGTQGLLSQLGNDGSRSRVRCVRHEHPGGPSAARNAGWREARGAVVAFTDDDCEADPDWLRELVESAGFGKKVQQGRTEPIPRELPRSSLFTRTIEVSRLGPYYPTCNVAYPRALLEELGGFDEEHPSPGSEDTDLALRAFERGAEAEYLDDARVFHAVNEYGPLGKLRWALHWSNAMWILGRHPSLRRELVLGVFWKPSHALLFLALLGLALAPQVRPALLLTLPYARQLRRRCIGAGAGVVLAPYLAIYDAVEAYAALRGGLWARLLVL